MHGDTVGMSSFMPMATYVFFCSFEFVVMDKQSIDMQMLRFTMVMNTGFKRSQKLKDREFTHVAFRDEEVCAACNSKREFSSSHVRILQLRRSWAQATDSLQLEIPLRQMHATFLGGGDMRDVELKCVEEL